MPGGNISGVDGIDLTSAAVLVPELNAGIEAGATEVAVEAVAD